MPLRVGFLGAGLIGTYHSKSLRASGAGAVWAAVHDIDPARAARFASATGAVAAASEEEVLDRSDAVYVCTWTSEHPRLVAAVAERGLPVFCEKPLATSLGAAVEMAACVADAGVVNQVGLVLRHSPAFALARDVIAGERVMSVVFRDDQFIPTQGHYASTWRGDVAKAGAGTLIEHSIHDVDLLQWMLGPVARVAADASYFHGIDGIEDSVAMTMRFESGALGTLVSVWHDILERPSLRRVEVFCERAYVAIENDWFGPVEVQVTGRPPQRWEGEALVDEARRRGLRVGNPDGEFVRAIETGVPAWPSFADAVAAHAIVDAAYRSAAEGGSAVEL